jgi:hypothetical protein
LFRLFTGFRSLGHFPFSYFFFGSALKVFLWVVFLGVFGCRRGDSMLRVCRFDSRECSLNSCDIFDRSSCNVELCSRHGSPMGRMHPRIARRDYGHKIKRS